MWKGPVRRWPGTHRTAVKASRATAGEARGKCTVAPDGPGTRRNPPACLTASIEILQVITSNARRGAETFAVALGEELARTSASVSTVALAGTGATSALEVPVLGKRPLAPATLRVLRRRAATADVVVAHGSRTLPACAIVLAGSRTPFVYRNIGDPAAWSGTGLRHLRTRWFLGRAAHVIALTDAAATTFQESYGIAPDKITVIPSAVRAEEHQPANPEQRVAARLQFGVERDATVVAVVGAFERGEAAGPRGRGHRRDRRGASAVCRRRSAAYRGGRAGRPTRTGPGARARRARGSVTGVRRRRRAGAAQSHRRHARGSHRSRVCARCPWWQPTSATCAMWWSTARPG